MIFDAHCHIYPDTGAGFWKRPSSAQDLVRAMDESGVAKAALIAIESQISTEAVCSAAARYPERLVAIGSVDPHDDRAADHAEHAVRVRGVRAIKLHPRFQKFGFEHLDRIQPIAKRCAQLGVPLVVCTFLGGRELFRGRILELCHELAAANPDTAVVMAHAGGYRPLDALMILRANPNVHVDLSFSPQYFADSSVQQDLAHLVKKADPRRVMFGSDFPEISLAASLQWLHDLGKRLGLKPDHLDAILHGNALRLFNAC